MVVFSALKFICLALSASNLITAAPSELQKGKRPDIEVASNKQPANVNCPAVDNGDRKYGVQAYSSGQVKAALLAAVNLQIDNKQIGANKYPHPFGNKERLPFDCGSSKREFPILRSGKVYNGEGVQSEPDRLVFEYVRDEKKNKVKVAVCGVMRHGAKGFVKC